MANSKAYKIHSLPTDQEIDYPESDGKPMAETDVHRNLMVDFIQILEDYFQNRLDVYVSGNLLVYYEKGDRKKSLAPDVFVAFGVKKTVHRTYQTWEEGKGPDFVLEISSKNTYRADLHKKKRLYAEVLEVPEYFLYDPDHRYLQPPLQGYRLTEGAYVEISPVEDRLPSNVLGLELGFQADGELGLYHPQTKAWLLPRKERTEEAETKAQQEAQARQRAEAELARLHAQLQGSGAKSTITTSDSELPFCR